MRFVHVKNGYGHGRRLINIDFPLVESFKTGSRGLYIVVSGEGLAGYPQRNFRVFVSSHSDVEFFEQLPTTVVEGVEEQRSLSSESMPLVLRGHIAPPSPIVPPHFEQTFQYQQADPLQEEPYDVIRSRMIERFNILSELSISAAKGLLRAMVVYGGPGIGKSYEVEDALKSVNVYNKILFDKMIEDEDQSETDPDAEDDDVESNDIDIRDRSTTFLTDNQDDPGYQTYFIHRGHITPASVYAMLYANRHKNQIIICDDSDGMLQMEDSLSLLKTALDTAPERLIAWTISGSRADGLPASFRYEGSMIFITNTNFETLAAAGTRISPHIAAILDRALYLDLMVSSLREILVRIDYVCKERHMFRRELASEPTPFASDEIEQISDVLLEWTHENAEQFRGLSLRKMVHLARLRKSSENWRRIAEVTLLRGRR